MNIQTSRRTAVRAGALAIAASLLLAACSSGGGGTSTTTPLPTGAPTGGATTGAATGPSAPATPACTTPDKITIALPTETGAQIIPVMAKSLGLFTQQCIDATITSIAGSQATFAALSTNQVQFANGDMLNALRSNESGLGVEVIAIPILRPVFDFIGSNSITSPQDLVGKTVAVTAIGNSTDLQLRAALQSVGVDPAKVNIIGIQDFAGIYAALTAGQIVAGTVAVPFNSQLVATGKYHQILDFDKTTGADYPSAVFTTTNKLIASNPGLVQRTVNAYVNAIKALHANPTDAKSAFTSFLKLADANAAQQTYDFFAPLFRDQPTIDANMMTLVLPSLAKTSEAHKTVDSWGPIVTATLNNDFVTKAIANAGS